MRHSNVYAVASKDIVFETFDGEAVVLDLSSSQYFGFSDSGSKVWQALSSGVGAQLPMARCPSSSFRRNFLQPEMRYRLIRRSARCG